MREGDLKPNLFIVGAMKCGTTILYDFLAEHPAISGARGKEVHYFSLFEDKGVAWYLDHFETSPETRYALDASPTYLDMAEDDTIPQKIRAFAPEAKIIIMIREPVERAMSQFKHLKHVNKRPEIQDMQFSDLMAEHWVDGPDHAALKRIRDMVLGFSHYSDKIARYARLFGADNVMVIHNDDLRRHGGLVMQSVYDFLGLDVPQGSDFTRQQYVRPAKREAEDEALLYQLAEQFGPDYWAACRAPGVTRPTAPAEDAEGNTVLNMPVGGRYAEVTVGQDGYLFLTSGSNSPVDMFFDDAAKTEALIGEWLEVIRRRKALLRDRGIEYFQCMVPEKISVLGDKLNWGIDGGKSYGARLFARAPEDLRDSIIHLRDFFANSPARDRLFQKTDSHWGHVGAFGAYQCICQRLGVSARADLLQRPFGQANVLFDLGSKLPEPVREPARFYQFRQEAEVVAEGPMVAFKRRHGRENDGGLHVGSIMQFANASAPDPRRVLLFGDSFSEYRDHLLTGLLSETFAELIFVWSTSVDYRLVDKYAPDVVLGVMTERFMTKVPGDNFDVTDYVDEKLAAEGAC